MWKDWKKKVSDFFFYEVEVESEEEIEEVAEPKQRKASTTNRQIAGSSRAVNAKVTYEYPKEQERAFRFPLIPDENEETQIVRRRKRMRAVSNADQLNKDGEKPLIYGYNRHQRVKELEDVPAYLRRKSRRKQEEVVSTEQQDTKNTKISLEHSTRPHELDRVFKKRDGLLEAEENVLPDEANREERLNNHFTEIVHNQNEKPITNVQSAETVPTFELNNEPIQTYHEPNIGNELDSKVDNIALEHDFVDSYTQYEEERIEANKFVRNASNFTEAKSEIEEDIAIDEEVPSYLLNDPVIPAEDDSEWLIEQQLLLEQTLKHFKVKASIVNVTQGPAVTRFEVQPALGVKVSKIRNLADDIKLNLSAKDIRIEAPIPGKNTVGIEVPNMYPQVVTLQEIIESEQFESEESPLTIALGLTIDGDPLITNVGKMPHGLIAGATGSGKSVCINGIILSILYKAHYDEVKLMLIDPKMVELTPYNGIPHLISPVITDVKAATMALKWAVKEMEDRYERFVEMGVRNIVRYNEKVAKLNNGTEKMPYIVIIIDELADLMMVSPQDVEDAICRIAQKARACGIHLILATQRPSVDVITGLIKANIPTRIAFSVSSQVDSRTIIDTNGAEKLLGKGDMLFVENGSNKSVRLQGPFVSDEEIDRVASYVRSLAKPNYLFEQEQLLIEVDNEEEDELMNEVISFVLEQNQVSTSLLQRRFRIGYNRAARLIDSLEQKGIISAQNGSKPREVLVSESQIDEVN